MNQSDSRPVTKEFRVDQYNRVYDASGVFYCTWDQLSEDEQAIVKLNPMSAK